MDGGSGEEGDGEDGGESGGCIVEDLVPRNNIAPQLTIELLDMIKVIIFIYDKSIIIRENVCISADVTFAKYHI